MLDCPKILTFPLINSLITWSSNENSSLTNRKVQDILNNSPLPSGISELHRPIDSYQTPFTKCCRLFHNV